MTDLPMLDVSRISKIYGTGSSAVEAIGCLDFTVNSGEIVCVVGPSGCGKTTMLKILSGLMPPTSGTASLDGVPITSVPKELALVFQEYTRSLLPWMTVQRNVALPLEGVLGKEERSRAVDTAIHAVGLSAFANKYPWQLSGGMQQRVAIARALAYRPKVLLMDEPFASVDAQTRADLEDLTLQLREEFGITVVIVTHDIDESIYLADRVVVLSKSPTRVIDVIDVDLPSPRDQITTKQLTKFIDARAMVAHLIMTSNSVSDGS